MMTILFLLLSHCARPISHITILSQLYHYTSRLFHFNINAGMQTTYKFFFFILLFIIVIIIIFLLLETSSSSSRSSSSFCDVVIIIFHHTTYIRDIYLMVDCLVEFLLFFFCFVIFFCLK